MSRRRKIDWTAAKAAYVTDPQRTYENVARMFGVSAPAVRRHANAEGWREAAERFDRDAETRALRAAVKSRDRMILDVLRVRDLALERSIADLEGGAEVKLSDLPGVVKLAELVAGEATERIDPGQVQQVLAIVLRLLPADKLPEFDRAVQGVLELGSGESEAA